MDGWYVDLPWQEVALCGLKVKWADVVDAGAENDAKWERDFETQTARIVPSRYSVGVPETGKTMTVCDGGVVIPVVTYLVFRLGDAAQFRVLDEYRDFWPYETTGL